ncbi:aldo-keto reductase family 1 member C13 [Lineolata rhizophorae]|uniref:Aldo-keto reductase family 1 member C13 n=1 Tax=Lineolata rhizophorae TaxID=578093 RepID=A0A6A6NRQ2_9PEZI|nr:aldo-keto reductase family 1 member C13 [Lineolata rhizophorae]
MANLQTTMPSLKLNDGHSIPMLGFGTGTAWYKRSEGGLDRDLIDAIKTSLKLGYYHQDCAEVYCTEQEVGIAIKESSVPREKLFVTTKVYRELNDIEGSLKASLKKLQLDYVDLYLIHSPFKFKSDEELQQAWATMESLREAGLAKSIGVSNYLPQHLEKLMKTAKVTPACNQIEFHPYLQHGPLLDVHKKLGIATAAYGPLTAVSKARPGPVDDLYAKLAKKYAVTESEIALRWCIDQDVVAITTSGKEQRMSDYMRALAFKLNPAEIKEIKELGEEKHFRGFWKAQFAEDDRS